MTTLIMLIIAYLLGSINFAILICKMKGLPDPRNEGSHNPGATNVLRFSDKQTAGMVLLADALKGFLPVVIAAYLGLHGFAVGLVGVAAVAGHVFPAFFKFEGGRGAATAAGVILGLSFFIGLLVLIIWFGIAYMLRYASLASLVGAIAAPVLALLFGQMTYFIPLAAIAALIVWRHWENIERLRAGTESKINW